MASSNSYSARDSSEVASQLTHFSTSLFQAVGKQVGASENVFISPFSVAAVLSMTHAGAKGNTGLQLENALHLTMFSHEKLWGVMGNLIRNVKGDENFTLEAANQMYVANNYRLVEQFQSVMKDNFGAPAQSVNFGADDTRMSINKWVEEFTHSKIKDLLPGGSIDSLTRLVLVNAVYFKGDWMRKFDQTLTKVEPFYLGSEDSKVDAHMMHIDGKFRTGVMEALDARVLELPYKGNKLSMLILLPNKIGGLPELESKLTGAMVDQIDQMIGEAKLQVAIPKFKIEADVPMKELLIGLGMGDLFDPDYANLSGISGNKDLYVSNVFHKSFVEVNEEGSEAAAATGAVMMTRMMILPPVEEAPFVVNHPAVFLIRDNFTKLVLFIGRLSKPQ